MADLIAYILIAAGSVLLLVALIRLVPELLREARMDAAEIQAAEARAQSSTHRIDQR